MKDKLLKTMLLLLLPLAFAGQAVGQTIAYGFVGKDKKVFYDCSQPSTLVSLGDELDSPSDAQFYWEVVSTYGESIFAVIDEDTRHAPVVVVSIYSENGTGSVVLCCTRTSKYGYQEEFVTIDLANDLELVVIPKKECWQHNETIGLEDFEIQTIPAGYESHVLLDDDSRLAYNHWAWAEDTQEIHFVSDDPARFPLRQPNTEITVIRESISFDLNTLHLTTKVKKQIEAFVAGYGFKDKFEKVSKAVEPIKEHVGSANSPVSFDVTPEFNVTYEEGEECCCSQPSGFVVFSGTAKVTGSFSIEGAPFTAIPFLHLFCSLSGSAQLGLSRLKYSYQKSPDCDCDDQSYLDVVFGAELEGGIALVGGSKDFLSVSGSVIGGISWPGKLYFSPFPIALITGDTGVLGFTGIQLKMDDWDAYAKFKVSAVTPFTTFEKEWKFAD